MTSGRDAIRSGALRGAALLARIRAVPPLEREAWVDDALGLPSLPDDGALPRDAVPYLPSGVDAILTAVCETPITERDRFVDLGSGLGRVPILVHLVSGARAHGIEIQPHLVAEARRCAEALALGDRDVTFDHANAIDAPLDGTVFYLYAPFGGATRARVLERLRAIAATRAIRICALGFDLRDEPWLASLPSSDAELSLYASR